MTPGSFPHYTFVTAGRCQIRSMLLSRLLCLLVCFVTRSAHGTSQIELLRDSQFSEGFTVLAPKAGQADLGQIQTGTSSSVNPCWQIAQWHSRFPFTNLTSATGAPLCISNLSKWLCLDRDHPNRPVLTMGVDSTHEYGATPRRAPTEPWVHLLLQQQIQAAPSLAEMASLRLRFEARLMEGVSRKDGRRHYLRVRLERAAEGYTARLTGDQGSGILSSLVAR